MENPFPMLCMVLVTKTINTHYFQICSMNSDPWTLFMDHYLQITNWVWLAMTETLEFFFIWIKHFLFLHRYCTFHGNYSFLKLILITFWLIWRLHNVQLLMMIYHSNLWRFSFSSVVKYVSKVWTKSEKLDLWFGLECQHILATSL